MNRSELVVWQSRRGTARNPIPCHLHVVDEWLLPLHLCYLSLILYDLAHARGNELQEAMVGRVILLLLSLLCLLRYDLVAGVLVNVTWDDSGLDPITGATWTYMPSDQWYFGPACSDCAAKLDSSQVRNKTWHDATCRGDLQHVQIDFVGTPKKLCVKHPAWLTQFFIKDPPSICTASSPSSTIRFAVQQTIRILLMATWLGLSP